METTGQKPVADLVAEVDLGSLIRAQALRGRRDFPLEMKERVREIQDRCGRIRAGWGETDVPEADRRCVELASILAHVPAASVSDASVDYAAYIDLPVLYWHLYGTTPPFPAPPAVVAQLITALARDVARVEHGTAPAWRLGSRGLEGNSKRAAFADEVVRIGAALAGESPGEAVSLAENFALDHAARPQNSLATAVCCSGFAQTAVADEFLFVRSLQMSELCFLAIRDAVVRALHAPENYSFQAKARTMADATHFADLLLAILRMLQSLSREDFLRFRELTGSSSAVQSFNYQSMEFVLYGPSEAKRRLLEGNGHYAALLAVTNPEEAMSLASFVAQVAASETGEEATEFLNWARRLDRRLLGWRSLHLRIAMEYVPQGKMGTGGTEGVPYLKKVLAKRLFPETAEDHD